MRKISEKYHYAKQSQVDEAGAVVTQGPNLHSLHLGEVDAHQTGAVSATEQDELF